MSVEAEEMMVEETVLENEDVVEDVLEGEEVEYSDVEKEAMQQGWNPEGVEGKRSLSAEEFLDRKPLYDKMHKLEKRLKDQDKKFDALQKHEKMVRERMHQDHIKELKEAKKSAFEEMDYDAVDRIDDEIHQAKSEYEKGEYSVQTADTIEESVEEILEDWVSKNTWYKQDAMLQREAEKEGKLYRMDNPNASFEDVLDYISTEIKQKFPEKFQTMKRSKPSSVEGATTSSRRPAQVAKQKTVKDLPEEAIPVMKMLVRGGTFPTEQDYVNDYFNNK